MKIYKKVLPYVMAASSLMPAAHAKADAPETGVSNAPEYSTEYLNVPFWEEFLLGRKAGELRDAYISNSVNGCQNLRGKKGTKGYVAAVRRELPGAPVGMHCLYGQSFQLNRALGEQGDTLNIIPQAARQSCIAFKNHMKKSYGGGEYAGALKEGKMFESDSAYAAALEKYLAGRKIGPDAPVDARNAAVADFAARNFSIDAIDAGSVLIVPRGRKNQNKFHAVMYLGRGRMENGRFVADANGAPLYVGYNNESIGNPFRVFDTDNVFAADIKKIAKVQYAHELARIKAMSREELAAFLASHGEGALAEDANVSREEMVDVACAKYFGYARDFSLLGKAYTSANNAISRAVRPAVCFVR